MKNKNRKAEKYGVTSVPNTTVCCKYVSTHSYLEKNALFDISAFNFFSFANACSLLAKTDVLWEYAVERNLHIIGIAETLSETTVNGAAIAVFGY